ncbi:MULTISPECIES: hypothetical protein [unclassified Lysobacter]|uniref:hypothetical protein n=1 Tax=unclassified Lysobacter TaxID=2635362 RepID=UPI0012FA1CE6|nr:MULTISPECIES: hypothetical protein [unclassified Lysobacter]
MTAVDYAELDSHRRGIAVRLLTDNDKRHDDGSDIARLREHGVPVRIDDSY